jgi:CheY-like chemotaxis protein
MPQGGTLVVGTATRRIDTEQPLSHGTLGAGTWAVVSVSDEGQGMDADVVEHLFEPFFTTRAAQGGTGLGLAMVHGAVREMSGVIDVRSAPGQGARFELCFPLTTATMAPAIDAAPAAPRGTGQVVMIVDDEPALVAMTEDVVAGLGYEPVGFVDPRQALAALQATPERFDVVLTDQVMPHLVGTELTRRLHRLRPQLPVLLASGYGGPDLDRQAAAAGVRALLQKPLHRGELATHLARVLAAA